ncbi:MAG: DUF1385 domain-containing protein [Oscillospiraceae bacterium]|jgi:uncharacterized protein YqhQ|nr:DUF1385 domain-containing protein [Oscillospiraceae bacterium]
MAKKQEKNCRLGTAGGQALIEGIMMNSPNGAAVAVRKPDGSIVVKRKNMKRLKDRYKVLGLPFVRGIVGFIESMILGYKSLMESAELSGMLELEESEKEQNQGKFDAWLEKHLGEKMMGVISVVAMVLGLGLAMLLFTFLPAFLFDKINLYLADGGLIHFKALFEGVIRIVVFILYLFAVSKMKEIKRTFMYHGAEHKTIFCYEANEELVPENIKKFVRFHPRCGTSFLFTVLVIGILISSAVLTIFPVLGQDENRLLWVAIKILIMPLIMGVGYEFIRFAGRHDNAFTRLLSSPGLLMQRLTTIEPTEDMLEVAVAALEGALATEDFGERILNAPKAEDESAAPSDEPGAEGEAL